jgi:hypothetical protein
MATAAYLSIDMDYWFCAKGREALHFLQRVFALHVPVFVCESHEFLLNDPNLNLFRRIIHIDYHSDSSHVKDDFLHCHCGNWLDYVPWQAEGEITWHYPNDAAKQIDGDYSSPFLAYKTAVSRKGLPKSLKKVGAVGISYDSSWFEPSEAYYAAADCILDNIASCTLDKNPLDNDLRDYLPTSMLPMNTPEESEEYYRLPAEPRKLSPHEYAS